MPLNFFQNRHSAARIQFVRLKGTYILGAVDELRLALALNGLNIVLGRGVLHLSRSLAIRRNVHIGEENYVPLYNVFDLPTDCRSGIIDLELSVEVASASRCFFSAKESESG